MPVVIYRYSTSNHNHTGPTPSGSALSYIVILHQTTTDEQLGLEDAVVIYRYSTSNHNLCVLAQKVELVVIYRYSTSNHNAWLQLPNIASLSYIVILHQTTTFSLEIKIIFGCHISLFYIKPQLSSYADIVRLGCHISLFYIKPQPTADSSGGRHVVIYRYSTSNHNTSRTRNEKANVVIYRYSTSNHNRISETTASHGVVIYRYSTSNHNSVMAVFTNSQLSYIVILHQTTTLRFCHT